MPDSLGQPFCTNRNCDHDTRDCPDRRIKDLTELAERLQVEVERLKKELNDYREFHQRQMRLIQEEGWL